MKYKKFLITICAALFFISALTSYLNRIIFPRLIKGIVLERIEETLRRKVEIGSIRFNWVKGFIIDRIKVYDNSPQGAVFAQADQVSFGIVILPGFNHYRINIPFINVRSPSVHLIKTSADTWNFSDIYASPPQGTKNTSVETAGKKPSFDMSWGGITISDGKVMVEDLSTSKPWSEIFDTINLKLSLSYKGIYYDFTANIPDKNGLVGATVYYQPLTHNTQASIHLRNIDTASYISLINLPDMHIDSGIIKEIDLNITYAQDKTSAQGNVLMKDLDLTSQDRNFKGDVDIKDLDAVYRDGDITARGQMSLNNIQTKVPGLTAGGTVQTKVENFELTRDGVDFNGSLRAQDLFVRLKDRQVQADDVTLGNIRVRKDNAGIQSVGNITTHGLLVEWPDQKLQGDISLRSVTMSMKDENDIKLQGDFQADHFSTGTGDKTISSAHLDLQGFRLEILDQKNVSLSTKLSLVDLLIRLGKSISVSAGSINAEKLLLNYDDNIIKVTTNLNSAKGKLVLDNYRTIEADPQLELDLQIPLKDPQKLTYKGSVTLSDGSIRGFPPIPSLNNVELDADFQNDQATINALSINILDTNVRVTGSVNDFKNPVLDIIAEADELNLARIKDLAPELAGQFGLDFNGSTSIKIKFQGLASKPLAGNILAVASVKNVSVSSSKFHQQVKDITGIVEATPDSLKWRDTTVNYQGRLFSLSGSLNDFKKPRVQFTIDGKDLQVKGDIIKERDRIALNSVSGKYMNAAFDSKGSIYLPEGEEPEIEIDSHASLLLENLIKMIPAHAGKGLEPFNPTGIISMNADIKGTGLDWKTYTVNGLITSPTVVLKGYALSDMNINIAQSEGKIKNLTFDGKLYDGTVHAVGSVDLTAKGMPYDLALNIDSTDLHKLKMDTPLKMEEIDGKFYLTTLAHGTLADFKDSLHATGSLAIRDGFLGEFNLFKGLLGILNDVMRLGQIEITDVEGNFTVDNQKINTDNLRLKGPTIVLLSKGWVNFNQMCDLDVTVDLSSGVVPDIAHDVLNTLNIHIYDNIANPQFKKKISVPQVINTILKNLLQ